MTLTEVEMIEILEGIARRSSNQSARIGAIRELLAIREADKQAEREAVSPLDELYERQRP